MKSRPALAALIGSLLFASAAAQLAEYGIEGMGVVSTRDTEVRASVSADGKRIVWGSTDRAGGAGGWDLWQARLQDKRWTDPQPLRINTPAKEFDPLLSADGKWLYFFSDRKGGQGGDDLYRAAVQADGSFGVPENLGPEVNSKGDEWAPTPSADGKRLLFASDGLDGNGGHDLFVVHWNGKAFTDPQPVPGVNTKMDEFDAAWLDGGNAIVFARSADVESKPTRLQVAHCDGEAYADIAPWKLSFNTAEGATLGPVMDVSRSNELMVTGSAPSPKAGKLDIYRALAPTSHGKAGCLQ